MLNKLLERQLRRYIKTADISNPEFQDLFTAISQAYTHNDEDRQLIERSLDLSSRELSDANKALREASRIIEIRNKEMVASLEYARLVQNSLLAKESSIFESFPNSFILNRPRDIVGGDFFWVREEGNRIFFCVADCTGHGVPGAFMSVISFRLLNQAVRDEQIFRPEEILTFLNNELKKVLSEQPGLETRDALDISMLVLDKQTKQMIFSGLGQRVLMVRNREVREIRGDRAHIGMNLSTQLKPISFQEFNYQEGDVFYLFSDGMVDQFGGRESRKFGFERLSNFLGDNADLPLADQKRKLESIFDDWKGEKPQIDDVLVIGIRL